MTTIFEKVSEILATGWQEQSNKYPPMISPNSVKYDYGIQNDDIEMGYIIKQIEKLGFINGSMAGGREQWVNTQEIWYKSPDYTFTLKIITVGLKCKGSGKWLMIELNPTFPFKD